MVSKLQQTSAVFAMLIYLLAPTLHFGVEWYVSKMYMPYYSYMSNFTSDLGVPYAYTEPKTGHLINSWRAVMMNLAFAANGLLFLAGHIFLLQTRNGEKYSTTRTIVAALYCIGLLLIAVVPGGPKELESGSIVWHALGGAFSIIGGNVNSILVGLAASKGERPLYRNSSLALGMVGISGLVIFFIAQDSDLKGFWQRSAIYPTQVWQYLTAVSLAFEMVRPTTSVKKD